MGYQFTPNLTVDLGLTLIDGKKVDVTEKWSCNRVIR
ncbi:hypothetical protein ACSZNO_06985 [Aeromonas veronii]